MNPIRVSPRALFLNPEKDGTSRTIKAQYYKTSAANFVRKDSLGATGVIEIWTR